MKGLDRRPLAWGLGAGVGATLAIALGAYGLGWGATLAFPATALVLSVGVYFERDGQHLAHALRFGLGLTLGYLACAVPLTWQGLFELVEQTAEEDPEAAAAQLALAKRQLIARWSTIFLAIPGASATLWIRRRRR